MPRAQTTGLVTIANGFPVVNIGALRHKIVVQALGPASPPGFDAAGPKLVWSAFASAFAAIDIVRGIDVIRGGQTTTQLFLDIVLWYQPGILPNMRVVNENGSTYVIQSVENVLEMNIVLVLNCIGIGLNE